MASFHNDILPLFTKIDIDHMARAGVLLDNYDYMKTPSHAAAVYGRLTGETGPVMPPPPAAPWTKAQIELFKSWMDGGFQP